MKKRDIFLISIVVILFSIIFLSRSMSHGTVIIDDEAYFDLVSAQNYNNGADNVPFSDLYVIFLHFVGKIVNYEFLLMGLSFLSAIITIILLSSVYEKYKLDNPSIYIIHLVMIFSPQFISSYTISIRKGVAFLLLILTFYLLSNKNKRMNIISIIPMILYITMGLYNVIMLIILFIIVFAFEKKMTKTWMVAPIVFLGYYLPFLLTKGVPYIHFANSQFLLKDFFSDFGGLYGASIFGFILAIMGVFLMWKKTTKIILLYLTSVSLIVISYFMPEYNYFVMLLIAIFAGGSIYYYYKRTWKADFIKNLTLMVIICGLLFSFISFIVQLEDVQPTENFLEMTDFLQNLDSSNIISHYSNGFMIEYYSDMDAVFQSHLCPIDQKEKLCKDTEILFASRNLENTMSILQEYKVKYIIITPEMKNGLVWSKENEGMLFLFRNKNFFRQIYNSRGYEVWQVLKDV